MYLNKNTETNYLARNTTDFVKGIALVFMFIHHFFTFPGYYIEGISYPCLSGFAEFFRAPFAICVPIFAFLTGYFYYFSKDKSLWYSLKKCTDVWITYIFIFFLMLIPLCFMNRYEFTLKGFALEFFVLDRPTMSFCWYVLFYMVAIFLLPIYAKLTQKSTIFPLFSFIIAQILLTHILLWVLPEQIRGIVQIVDNLYMFPCVGVGYLFAKLGFFYDIVGLVRIKNTLLRGIVGLVIIVASMIVRNYECPDYILAPLCIFGICELYSIVRKKTIFRPISIIGCNSLTMWFFHAVFFNAYKDLTQPILFFPRNPILVTIWGLVICLFLSYLVKFPIKFILNQKNKCIRFFQYRDRDC